MDSTKNWTWGKGLDSILIQGPFRRQERSPKPSGLRFGSLMSQLEGGRCQSVVKIPATGPVQQSRPGARPGMFSRVICVSRLAGNPNGRKGRGIFRASTKCHAQCGML